MQHLNDTFPYLWNGRGSTINWLPRSPGPTPLDELLDRIMDATDRIKKGQDELRRETSHVLTRVAKCIEVDGGIFENLL
jgi:hypothetical protein